MAISVSGPAKDPYEAAFAAYPGTAAKLDKTAAKRKPPMTRAQYVAFLVSKDVGTR